MNDQFAAMYQESQRKLHNALQALQAVEWVSGPYIEDRWCPWCGNYEEYGHRFDCQRQAALGIGA